jgi:sterol desaturase/sphingolipid hydroxylase (fatty acid hydroxylase superfamily)
MGVSSVTALRFFARHLYVPTMIFGMNGLAIYLMANGYRYLWLAFIILAAIGLTFLMERLLPYEAEWNRAHDDVGKDVAHGLVYETANIVTLGVLLLISLGLPAGTLWPRSLPIVVQFLLAILIADCVMTMIHYFSHRIGWLWKFHSIHHGVARLYGFNGFVRHPLHQAMDISFGTLPLVIAGLPVRVAAALGVAISVQLVLQHSNVDYRLGPLRALLSIGQVHRLHHVNWAGDGDVNFGLFLTVWDRLLGSFKLGSDQRPGATDIGIQDCRHFPQVYARQLRIPFERESPCDRLAEARLSAFEALDQNEPNAEPRTMTAAIAIKAPTMKMSK